MAEDIGSLYVRLGLDISELETGFVAVGRTVNENVRRLNRESDLVRLRSEVEITGLDETADAARILEIRQESLNRQMEIQRDRVRILTAELQNLTDAHGSEAVITQRAAIRLERERLALAQLERDLRNTRGTQEETNSLFDELADLLPPIPTKLQAIGLAAGAVASGFGAAGAAVNELLEDFRELQTQAYELNLPFDATKNLLRDLKLAGGDIGDFEGYIRGITDAYVKGEYDDPEFIALRRYGAEITDTTGKLKNFAEISDEVFKAWEKAEAEGNGIEFLQLTGGESGIRDAIQLFKRLKEAREDAAKIYDANLDADQLHELDRAFALVEEQAKELKNAIGNIFVPAAQAAAEKLFQTLHDGTERLVENKDAIQRWGFIADEVFSTVADKVKNGYTAVGEFIEDALKPKNTTGNEKVDKLMSGMDWRYGSAQTPYGVDKMTEGFSKATDSYGILGGIVERATENQKAFNNEIEESADNLEELAEKLEDADGNPLSQYGWQRVQQFKAELAELRAELDNWGNDYETALAQLDLWRDQELTQKNYVSTEEREAIEELYSAKLEQIEQERADRISEIRRSVDAESQTALEQRLAKIEEGKEAWISAGMEEAEAEQLAEQQKSSYIQSVEAELAATIQGLRQTTLEQTLSQIEQEKQAWIDKGASEAQAEEFAQEKIRQANEATENKLNEIRESVASLDRTDLENKLAAIEAEKQSWIELGMSKVEAEELAQRKIQHVMEETFNKERDEAKQAADDRAKAMEDYHKRVQAAQEEAERKNEALRNEAFSVLKSEAEDFKAFLEKGYEGLRERLYDNLIKSGVDAESLKKMTPDKLEDYKAAKNEAMQSFLPNWEDPYSAEPVKKSAQAVQSSFDNVSAAANDVAKNLDNLSLASSSYKESGKGYPVEAVVAPDGTTMIRNAEPTNYDSSPTVNESLNELPTIVQGISDKLTEMASTQSDETVNPFSNLAETLEPVTQHFTELNTGVSEVTVKINDLYSAIESFLSQGINSEQEPREIQPVEVNTTVEIEEAHAWDYDHIQELADKVAEIISPVIISAVGGDSNSY